MATASLTTTPTTIAAASDGSVYVTNTGASRVTIVNGTETTYVRRGRSTNIVPTASVTARVLASDGGTGSISYDVAPVNTGADLVRVNELAPGAGGGVTGNGGAALSTATAIAADPAFTGTYAPINGALGRWRAVLANTPASAKMALVGPSTMDESTGAQYIYGRLRVMHTRAGEALEGMTGANILDHGENGYTLRAWLDEPAKLAALVTAAPHLVVASWLTNDVRLGLCDLATAKARLTEFVNAVTAALPSTDILLLVPNPLLTTNVSSLNYVQSSGGTINPAGAAQTYTEIMRDAHLALAGTWAHVAVADLQADVFGTICRATHPLIADQLHPSPSGSSVGGVPTTSGYAAIGDYIAAQVGMPHAPWVVDSRSYKATRRCIVVAGGSAYVDIGPHESYDLSMDQYPLTTADALFVEGMDSPISLSGKTIIRPFGSGIRIIGLTGLDFTNSVGREALVASNHPDATTGDRQIVSVDLPSVAAGAIATQTVAVTGVSTANNSTAAGVVAVPPNAFAAAGLVMLNAYPANTDSVVVVVYNPTGSAIDRGAENWAFWVVR